MKSRLVVGLLALLFAVPVVHADIVVKTPKKGEVDELDPSANQIVPTPSAWTRFRGPNGTGIADGNDLPVAFDAKNTLWKVKIPGVGNSSPVLWKDRIFLQTSAKDGKERFLLCLSTQGGKELWKRSIPGSMAKTHVKNTLASATPAVDEKMVYAAFWDGQDVTVWAYDHAGNPKWDRNLGPFVSQHGAGASPVVFEDKLIFANDMDKKSVLYVFDKETGKVLWSKERPAYRACYSGPLILERNGKPELIVQSTTCVTSYDFAKGDVNWNWTPGFTAKFPLRTIATPVVVEGILMFSSGDGGGDRQAYGVALPAKDGLPKSIWQSKKDFPYVPSMLGRGSHLYFVNDLGFAGCYDAVKGERVWFERMPGAKFTASPVLVDGKIYACSEEGDVFVFAAEPAFKLLARNSLGEMVRATPAVADGRLYIRGATHLYCIGKK